MECVSVFCGSRFAVGATTTVAVSLTLKLFFFGRKGGEVLSSSFPADRARCGQEHRDELTANGKL